MLVAGLLVSSISARADDETPTPVPAQDTTGQSTQQAAGDSQQPITPPDANAPQPQGENNAASNGSGDGTGASPTPGGSANATSAAPSGNANASDTPPASNGDGDHAAPQSNASSAAPAGNGDKAAAGQNGEESAAAGAPKSGAKEAAAADKRTAAKKAAADKAAKAKSTKPGPADATPEIAKVALCHDLNAAQVAELIDQDYTQNRFQRSEQDQQAAGGRNINAWVNPEDVTGVGDVWQAPLKVRGNEQDLNYAVTLDCTKGEITYRLTK
ncbi:YebF family protein [Candidatus Sodalis pierantonius]|uniref:YebF family protein n=1 Tax=Candidatus Sodalis pierantonii TaxID=1486991 RepID=UPI00046D6F42|nr:YebF family protein [Candidatus Sodalis pierantonius]